MTITPQSPFKSHPRIRRPRFRDVLMSAGSPWASQAGALYDLIVKSGHDPASWLAIAGREHRYGSNPESVLGRNATNSWTNARSVRVPGMAHEIITDAVRGGPYVRYRSVEDSLIDGMYRIDDPTYVYRQRGATSIAQVINLWTEDDAADYIAFVVNKMNEWDEPVAWEHVISGLIDVRGQLATASGGNRGPTERLTMGEKRGVVIHYGGPPPSRPGTLEVAKSYAQYHVDKDWSSDGSRLLGTGLMYHVAIGAGGEKWLCRDLDRTLWHCGVTDWNRRALSVQFLIGGDQHASDAAITAGTEVVDDWRRFTQTPRSDVRGHQELSGTSCPGTLMADFVYPYREGKPMADGQWFDVTKHFVGGGFWQFWQSRGGLPVFGYPLTEEFLEASPEDGVMRTTQYFERAVFEYHADKRPPNDIQLRRLGAYALESKP